MATFAEYLVANAAGLAEDTFETLAESLAAAITGKATAEKVQTALDAWAAELEPIVDEPTPAGKGKGKGKGRPPGKGKGKAAKAEYGEVVIVTDCPTKGGQKTFQCLFGATQAIKEELQGLNVDGYAKLMTYNGNFEFGAGWRISDDDRIEELTDLLDSLEDQGVTYRTLTAEEYSEEVRGKPLPAKAGKGKGKGAKAPPPKGKGKVPKTPAPKAPAKGKGKTAKVPGKAPKAPAKGKGKTAKVPGKAPAKGKGKASAGKAIVNDWENNEHVDTGIVFVMLPVGVSGRPVSIAVGKQDTDSKETGLASVVALDDDDLAVCKKNKFRPLTEDILAKIEEADADLHAELEPLLPGADADEVGEEDGEAGDEEADADEEDE